jgi:hypothetical protein
MHREILTKEQIKLLPLVKSFSDDFGLVGGTAIALHLGHRRSIDFDLFSKNEFDNQKIRRKILKFSKINQVIRDETDQFTLQIKEVRFTFLFYPYPVIFSDDFENIIKLPDLLSLAAMKAFALGRRAKWKDYVDLYFVATEYQGIENICKRANEIFGNEFNEKIFRAQLSYFKDVDFTEKIIYLRGFKINDKIIKKALINFSLKTK